MDNSNSGNGDRRRLLAVSRRLSESALFTFASDSVVHRVTAYVCITTPMAGVIAIALGWRLLDMPAKLAVVFDNRGLPELARTNNAYSMVYPNKFITGDENTLEGLSVYAGYPGDSS